MDRLYTGEILRSYSSEYIYNIEQFIFVGY